MRISAGDALIRLEPKDVVLALLRVVSGDVARSDANLYLDPKLKTHMDDAVYSGTTVWFMWVHLIRNCGAINSPQLIPDDFVCHLEDPQIVELSAHWAGFRQEAPTQRGTSDPIHLKYRVQDGRITEIWTGKNNYVFIFGPRIADPIWFRVFQLKAAIHFALLWARGIKFRSV